ncbi:MAG TPA: hypothetical protein VGI66_01555 [Streptosporangiaceae bacterium]
MLTVAILLVWDAARTKIAASGGLRRPRPGPVPRLADGPGYLPPSGGYSPVAHSSGYRFRTVGGSVPQAAAAADLGAGPPGVTQDAGSRSRPGLIGTVLAAAGLIYAAVVGAFSLT